MRLACDLYSSGGVGSDGVVVHNVAIHKLSNVATSINGIGEDHFAVGDPGSAVRVIQSQTQTLTVTAVAERTQVRTLNHDGHV